MVILDGVQIVAGVVLVVGTVLSAVRTVVLPRAAFTLIGRVLFPTTRGVFLWIANRRKTFEDKDRVLAMYAPVVLLLLPFVWATLVTVGYALIYMGSVGLGWVDAFELSGSSLLTLGFANVDGSGARVVVFSEAALGLVIVALLITFLPSLYSAFSQREQMVNELEVRAGTPPSAEAMLIRHHRIMGFPTMAEGYADWERWFVNLEETHSAFPVLTFFRSPIAHRSWITAAGTVLDGGALLLALIDEDDREHRPQVALAIRAGFIALRRIGDSFRIPYDPDPDPTDPIAISRDEFDALAEALVEAEVPIVEDRDQAWLDYAGWRVNYDAVLLGLSKLIVAPEAPWTSDRDPRLAGEGITDNG